MSTLSPVAPFPARPGSFRFAEFGRSWRAEVGFVYGEPVLALWGPASLVPDEIRLTLPSGEVAPLADVVHYVRSRVVADAVIARRIDSFGCIAAVSLQERVGAVVRSALAVLGYPSPVEVSLAA